MEGDFLIYVLKFGASFILPPGIFFIIFFIISFYLFRQNFKKMASFLFLLTFLFYLLSTNFVAFSLLRPLEEAYTLPTHMEGDSIIMLGGGSFNRDDIDGEGTLASSAASRLLTVARIYQHKKLPIILAGGHVFLDTASEADIARRMLLSLGIPASDIFVENMSRTTTENAKYCAKILSENNLYRPILVTSAFHLKRAVKNFQKEAANVAVIAYPCDYLTPRKTDTNILRFTPSGDAFFASYLALREYLRIWIMDNFEK